MEKTKFLLSTVLTILWNFCVCLGDFGLRQCEPIRIEMCRSIGYNETSMPNLVGNELQSDAEYTLQTFSPLIDYVCSTQLKFFLCATYVPMCTSKVPLPIGPCRTLCESVRSRCHPVLQGFGFPWPPALDCNRFPKENNHETMCMEGPGEMQEMPTAKEMYPMHPVIKTQLQSTPASNIFECPGYSKLYVKLHRLGRCAALCEANILFGPKEKHVVEVWTHTWTYAAVVLALLAIIRLLFLESDSYKSPNFIQTQVLSPLMWSHSMVVVGWCVRFIAGRKTTSCGFDPQLPNVSLLLVDGLSNVYCAATFILRYYFGMSACAWWAVYCLGWHRDVRCNSPDSLGHMALDSNVYPTVTATHGIIKSSRVNPILIKRTTIISSNLARFLAWGLPAFQTAAVIVSRLVDADEFLGACFVGNQSDKGLQIFVATPLFCYWIFGSMNLVSGFLVYRRNNDILRNTNSMSLQLMLQSKFSISGMFLTVYCIPYALLLLAVIYEFANIDVWLNESPHFETPELPFITKVFMELLLGIICSAWILGPKISSIYKRRLSSLPTKSQPNTIQSVPASHSLISNKSNASCRTLDNACSMESYQTVRQKKSGLSQKKQAYSSKPILKNHLRNCSYSGEKVPPTRMHPHIFMNSLSHNDIRSGNRRYYGDETII